MKHHRGLPPVCAISLHPSLRCEMDGTLTYSDKLPGSINIPLSLCSKASPTAGGQEVLLKIHMPGHLWLSRSIYCLREPLWHHRCLWLWDNLILIYQKWNEGRRRRKEEDFVLWFVFNFHCMPQLWFTNPWIQATLTGTIFHPLLLPITCVVYLCVGCWAWFFTRWSEAQIHKLGIRQDWRWVSVQECQDVTGSYSDVRGKMGLEV